MIGLEHKAQVLDIVVELVSVDVVDVVFIRDWAVVLFPYGSVLKLISISAADVPSEHPVTALLVPARVIWPFSFKVGPTLLVAVDSFVARIPSFAFCAA
jgi:hypothetical protein